MNSTLRWMLILGCLMLAVLEAPRSSALVAEDFAGPYCEPLAAHGVAAGPEQQVRLARPHAPRANELTLAELAAK